MGEQQVKLINADCIEAMKAMPDNSVDSIVTDPPYELGFMGKSWDASGIAFNIEVWQEALRVIKPGGHLIAFSGSRTYHRMAVAIEDAGFQIRDQIMWVYGSGFPKSHNIAKQLDKLAGVKGEIIGEKTGKGYSSQQEKNLAHGFREYKDGLPYEHADLNEYALASDEAKQWDGWGTALKPAHEPMVLARKPLEGTVANNVLTFGTGGLNIDGSRVGSEVMPASTGEALSNGKYGDKVWDTPEKTGRFPANFIHDGSDEVVALFPDTKGFGRRGVGKGTDIVTVFGSGLNSPTTEPMYNDSGSAARFFYCAKASKRDRNEGLDGFDGKEIGAKGNGLARKCATCSASVIDGCACPDRTFINPTRANHHPTVKPTTLMQYLVRLVTPPNGIVLDPFMGSGSTGKACAYEGFEFIGIDQSAEYVAIAQARIDFALADKSDELPL
jgi:site-specific DNA-methyltransferase (adenine-specific)